MLLRFIFITVGFLILFLACSKSPESTEHSSNAQPQNIVNKPTSTKQVNHDALDNINLADLAKNKIPGCINSCKKQYENCSRGCRNSCKRQCTYDDCNLLDKEKTKKCQKKCFAECDNGPKCDQYCSREQKFCVKACPQASEQLDPNK